MKKSLIALAVAGAMTAPIVAQADATLYGSLRVKLNKTEDMKLDLKNNSSRIGIKGSVDTNMEGVNAIYRAEWSVGAADVDGSDNPFKGRLGYVGLKGDFGTVKFGTQWTGYYNMVQSKTDILNGETSGAMATYHRANNTSSYTSPNMNGFQVALALVTDGGASGDDNVDGVNLSAHYEAAGFGIGLSAYDKSKGDTDVALAVSYETGPIYVAAQYENQENADLDQWALAASYTMGNNTFAAHYDDLDNSNEAYGVEWAHKLGKQASLYTGIYENAAEKTVVEAGLRVDF